MHFKLIIALVDDDKTKAVIDAAREAGLTGATIIGNVLRRRNQTDQIFLWLNP